MKIIYITNLRLPTEKAHGIQIIEMCKAFFENGHSIRLVIPCRKSSFNEYKNIFPIKRIWTIDLLDNNRIMSIFPELCYYIQLLSFALLSLFERITPIEFVYTRDKPIVILMGLKTKNIIYEAHDSASSFIDKMVANNAVCVVTISKSIDKSWRDIGAKTIYAPDAVSNKFFCTISKNDSRKRLNIPQLGKLVTYTGNLYGWKGVSTLLEAAKMLTTYNIYIVGGEKEMEFSIYRKQYEEYKNIHFIGNRPHDEIPLWLKASDVLVIPNSASTIKGSQDTSPLKLFEYLASGTPIVASKVPAVMEVVGDNRVSYFRPDDAISLAETITDTINKNTTYKNDEFIKQLTWNNRVKTIIDGIGSNNNDR